MEFIPLGKEYLSIDNVLVDIDQKGSLYESSDKANRLYHTPFFVFQSDQDGNIDVRIIRHWSDDDVPKSEVKLTLLVSPVAKKNVIAQAVQKKERQNPSNSGYARITESDIITMPFLELHIKQTNTSKAIFAGHSNSHIDTPSSVDIIAVLPTEKAELLFNGLKSGDLEFQFEVEYKVNVKFVESESSASNEISQIYNTKSVKELTGTSKAFSWSASTNTLQTDATYLTRNQKDTFEGNLKSELTALYDIENKNDLEFLQAQLNNYSDKLFTEKFLDIRSGDFEKDIRQMSAYGFSANDLAPDKITRFVNDIQTEFKDTKHDKIEANASADGGMLWGLLGGKASGGVKKDELREIMEKKGWKFEQEGEIYVPKGFNVYVLNNTELQKKGFIKVKIKNTMRDKLHAKTVIKTRTLSENYRNNTTSSYKNATDKTPPVGTILAWHKNINPDIALPLGWEECNGQVITNEDSPLFGITLPNLNGEQRFLRGGKQSGILQEQDWKSFTMLRSTRGMDQNTQSYVPKAPYGACSPYVWVGSSQGNNDFNVCFFFDGSEVRPKNMSIVYIIKTME